MNKSTVTLFSAGLVVTMLVHATEGVAHGKAPSETHLITGAPLTVVASTAANTAHMDYVQYNAVYDAAHAASVPHESELRLGGLTISCRNAVTTQRRRCGRPDRERWSSCARGGRAL